jgi:acetyl esterase/lipase
MSTEGKQVAKWLQENGITAFVLRYRLANNRHPAMIQDLQRAIQMVREHAADYGINPRKLGVMGFSAGGHLAGTAATYFDQCFMDILNIQPTVSMRPDFVAMIYPVVSMTDSIGHRKSRRNLLGWHADEQLKNMLSLELHVRQDMPPVFLVQCRKDKTVDYRNTWYYRQVLDASGITCDYTLYDEKGHGFGINPKLGHGDAPTWNLKFIPWLEKIGIIENHPNDLGSQ